MREPDKQNLLGPPVCCLNRLLISSTIACPLSSHTLWIIPGLPVIHQHRFLWRPSREPSPIELGKDGKTGLNYGR